MKKIIITFVIFKYLLGCSGIKNSRENTEYTFPIYGNYCGPLHPPIGTNPLPLDNVDYACKNHDKCYDVLGFFNKNCDLKIIEELKIVNPRSENEKLAKKLLIFYFQENLKI